MFGADHKSVSAQIRNIQSPLSAPSDVSVENGENLGEVVIAWKEVPKADFYRIGWIADADFRTAGHKWIERFAFVDIKPTNTHVVTRLSPGELYWFIVGSTDKRFGEAVWSEWQSLALSGQLTTCPSVLVPSPYSTSDYDYDDDGLIEISNLMQLNAIRWDSDGDGLVENIDQLSYTNAFPDANNNMGCPATGCIGYELKKNLDFDHDIEQQDNIRWTSNEGWLPIAFNGIFDGNGRSISNLYINRPNNDNIGLFSDIGQQGIVRNLGLINVTVTGGNTTGSIAGQHRGLIVASYATGTVSSYKESIGGLVGRNQRRIYRSHADVIVKGGKHVGGLVGEQ